MFKFVMCLFCLFIGNQLIAQNPWQQEKGEVLLSPYVSRYIANSFSDNNLNTSDFSNNGRYSNYVPKLYFSIGLKNYKTNIFGNIPFVISQYQDDFAVQKNNALGDVEIGVRRHFLKTKSDHYLMGSVSAYIPAYSNNATPFIGLNQLGLEARLYYTGNFKWLDINKNFHKIEVAVRYYFPNDPVQFRLNATQGYRFTERWVILGEVEWVISNSKNTDFSAQNSQIVTDFTTLKPSLSLGYEFSPEFSLYAGYFQDIYNRNNAIGHGYQAFAVIRL